MKKIVIFFKKLFKRKEKYLSTDKVGNMLGYTHDFITYLCRKNQLEGAKKVGKYWRIPKSSVKKYKRLYDR